MAITLNGTTGITAPALSGDGSGLTNVFSFVPTTTSGATQALDVGSFNFFDAGTLTADTTVSFTNVPTEARWTYTAEMGGVSGSSYDISAPITLNSFALSHSETTDLFVKPDGTKFYVSDTSTPASVHQYSLSTAWDFSTASYDSVSFNVSGQDSLSSGLFFKSDGTKMYVAGFATDKVYQYSLSTAWDVSTASYDSVSFSVSTQEGTPMGLSFKADGTRMYITGYDGDAVFQYNLSTAWNLATASYSSVSFSVAAQMGTPQALFFSGDGLSFFVTSGTNVYKYTLSIAWDLTTASYVESGSVGATRTGVFFKSDGEKFAVVSNNSVTEFSAQAPSTLTLPSSVQNPPSVVTALGDKVSYTFYTLDGGTTVKLINEEVL